jgi:hypothetical protein
VTKLYYPFDDIKRYPTSLNDPPAQLIDWEEWCTLQRKFDNRGKEGGKLGRGNEFHVKESDVFQMSPEQLDEYMDWYEKSWLDSKGTLVAPIFQGWYNLYTEQVQIRWWICSLLDGLERSQSPAKFITKMKKMKTKL